MTPFLVTFLQHCPNVEEINIASNLCVEKVFCAISENCPNLVRLGAVGKLCNLRLSTISSLLSRCLKLEALRLNNTDGSFCGDNFATLLQLLVTEHPLLVNINVTRSFVHWTLPPTGLVKHLISLTCDCFYDDTLTDFLFKGGGSQLIHLNLARCGRISVASSSLIGPHCPLLVELRLNLFCLSEEMSLLWSLTSSV